MRWAKNLQLWNEEHRVILKQRAKYWCVWEKSVHTSERISSFNICEMLENHNQHQAEKTGKWRIVNFFFSPFLLNRGAFTLVPVVSPGLEKKAWSETNITYHEGSAVLLDVAVSILLLNSGRLQAVRHSWRYLNIWYSPVQDGGCCSAPLLLLPLLAQAEVVWASRGFSSKTFVWKAEGCPTKHKPP